MIASPGKILADAAVCGVAVLFSLALSGCGGGFGGSGGAEGSPILDSGPSPEKIAVAAGDDISAEDGRKVAETVSRLNLGLGGGSVSPEDVRVSHDRAVLDRDPFSASSGVPAARKLGLATTRALRGRGYKAFEFPVPAESPIMTVAVWISETPPPDQKSPEGKPGDAPAKTIYVRLQVFVSPAMLGLAGSDAMVRELETEEVAVQVKTPKPKPQPKTPTVVASVVATVSSPTCAAGEVLDSRGNVCVSVSPPLVAVNFSAWGLGTLSAQSGGGFLSSGDEVPQGSRVTFTAVPAAGHYVSGWGRECVMAHASLGGSADEPPATCELVAATPAWALYVDAVFAAVPAVTAETVCAAGSLPANGMTQAEVDAGFAEAAGANDLEGVCEHLRRGAANIDRQVIQDGGWSAKKTPLMYAAKRNWLEMAKLLIANGAGVDVAMNWGTTPLVYAANAGNLSMLQLLVANGASARPAGEPPLARPASVGDLEVVKFLIAAGADVDARSVNFHGAGKGPLWRAAFFGRVEVVRHLLAAGADVNAKTSGGQPALHAGIFLHFTMNPLNTDLEAHVKITRMLIENGADVNATDGDGRTALSRLARLKEREMSPDPLRLMRILIDNGADINLADSAGKTPLHWGLYHGLAMVENLLGLGAAVNARDNAGRAPLDDVEEVSAWLRRWTERSADMRPIAAHLRGAGGFCYVESFSLCAHPPVALVAVNFSASGSGALSARNGDVSLSSGDEVRQGATVVFTAVPAAGHYVSGWGGACAGSDLADRLDGSAECWLAADADLAVEAEFSAAPSLAGPLCPTGTLPANGLTQEELDAGLIAAVLANDLGSACEYLRRGASAEARTLNRRLLKDDPALNIAARESFLDMAKLLVAHGAGLGAYRIPYHSHVAPLYGAARRGHLDMAAFLIESGADVNVGSSYREPHITPLFEAARQGNAEMAGLLLDNGANTELYFRDRGRTPLLESVKMGRLEVVKLLLAGGANVNVRKYDGDDYGSGWGYSNGWGAGWSPLDVAVDRENAEIAAVLREYDGRCFVQTGPLCEPLAGLATVTVIVTAMDESSPLVLAGDAAGEATTTVRIGEATEEIGRAGGVATLQATAYLVRRVTVIPATTVVTVLVEAATGENPNGPVSELIGLATLTNQAPPEVVVQAARLWKVSPTTVTVEVRTLVVKAENPGEPASELIALATVTNQAPPGIVVQVRELRTVYEFSALAGSECPSASLPANGRGVSELTRDLWKAIGEKNKEKACEALRRGAKTEGDEFSRRGDQDGSALKEITHLFSGRNSEDSRALLDIAKMVLARGANLNYRKAGASEWTPLHRAARFVRGSEKMVELLLEHGAEVNAQDRGGNSPLDLLAYRNFYSSPSPVRSAQSSAAAILREAGGVCFAERKALCWDAPAVLDFSTLGPGALSAQSEKHALSSGDAVPQGATVVFTAAPNAEHYVSGWTGGCAAVGGTSDGLDGTAKECALTADSSELRVRARFSPIPSLATADCPAGSLPANGLTQAALNLTLRAAARGGDSAGVCEALRRGAEVNDDQGGTEFTPLQEAVYAGHLRAAELLLANGAEVNARKEGLGPSPLDLAAKDAKEEIARVLRAAGGRCFLETGPLCGGAAIPVAEVSCPAGSLPADGLTQEELDSAFWIAANDYNWYSVERNARKHADSKARACEYLRRGANVDAWNGMGTMLHWVAAWRPHWYPKSNSPEVARFLLSHGADVNLWSDSGAAPLHYAVVSNHLAFVKLFLDHGADVDIRSEGQGTPLQVSARGGDPAMMKLLLAYGANVAAHSDERGWGTPLNLVADGQYYRESSRYAGRKSSEWKMMTVAMEKARILIAAGADVDAESPLGGGRTPLIRALTSGNLEIAELLIAAGADINKRGYWERTPLHMAVGSAGIIWKNVVETVESLLANGADILAKDSKDETPLDFARREYARSYAQPWSNVQLYAVKKKNMKKIIELLEAAAHSPATVVAARSVPVSEDRLALELRGRFGDAFNAGPAFGDSFGAVADSSGGLLSRLDGVMRGGVSAKEDWASFSGWQQENHSGRLWFSTRHRGDFGFGAGGGGLGGAVDGSPFAALSGNGLLAGGEMALGSGGSERLRFAAFGDLQSRSLLSGEERRWTDWAASGTAIETAMAEAERLSGAADNRTRGALTEIHLGDSAGGSGLAFQAGALSESESLLSGTSRGEDLRGLRSRTAFAGVSGSADLFGGGGWRVRGAAHVGRSWAESSGVLRSGDLWASSFSAGLERGGWLYSGDGVMFRISQPLRVESWEMDLMEGGEVRRLLVSPSGRQLDLDAAYRLPLSGGGWLLLSAGVRRGSGHVGSSGLEGGALFSLERDF